MPRADRLAKAKIVIANTKIIINARIFSGMQVCGSVLMNCAVFYTTTYQGSALIISFRISMFFCSKF
jgi:hypothetical protein